jgi:hypothetical protein
MNIAKSMQEAKKELRKDIKRRLEDVTADQLISQGSLF